MQISDMLGQYNRNVTNGTEELRSAQGVQRLVSTTGDLSIGSVFEGTVSQVKNGKVVLSLGNGQTVSARLEGKVNIKQGSSMFFQVKSNDGMTVSIRPYTGTGNAGNPILLDALSAAKIPVTERNLNMVDAMMQEQMPVGRQSILDMVKILNNNPNSNVETIVRMAKLGLPVTDEMASQFENYMSERHMILNEMEVVTNEFVGLLGDEALSEEDAAGLFDKVMHALTGEGVSSQETGAGGNFTAGIAGGTETAETTGTAEPVGADFIPGIAGGTETSGAAEADFIPGIAGGMETSGAEADFIPGIAGGTETLGASRTETVGTVEPAGAGGARESHAAETMGTPEARADVSMQETETLGSLLTEAQMNKLSKLLQNIPMFAGNSEIFETKMQGEMFVDTMSAEDLPAQSLQEEELIPQEKMEQTLQKEMPAGEFLQKLQMALEENRLYGAHGISKLFSNQEFQKLLRHTIERQWVIEPGELKQENRISRLYEKMELQIRQMEQAVEQVRETAKPFLQAAADVRGNIEFMNQMNQLYTYIQMPLKMMGQNANGELYVYTNKKKMQESGTELTAFLHLDMEDLGSTDVTVRLKDRKVNTNFYLPDDASYSLIEKHLPILEKRLKNKGYNCTLTIQNEKKDKNFMEEFLQKERAATAALHRYSFDVRA